MIQTLISVFALGGVVGYTLRGLQTQSETPDEITAFLNEKEAELRERYQTTSMDYIEFGDEVALLEDPDTEQIMRDAVDVDGIGPATALEIARHFDGYAAYQAAGEEEYQKVHRVGESKARALGLP